MEFVHSIKKIVVAVDIDGSDGIDGAPPSRKSAKKYLIVSLKQIGHVEWAWVWWKYILIREVFRKTKWKFKMEFSIERHTTHPPHFFPLQLNLTYKKRILHLVPDKNIFFKSSYIWLKIDILRLLRLLKAN